MTRGTKTCFATKYPQQPPSNELLNECMRKIAANYKAKCLHQTTYEKRTKTGSNVDKYSTLNAIVENMRDMVPHKLDSEEVADNEYIQYSGVSEVCDRNSFPCSLCQVVKVSGHFRHYAKNCNRHPYCVTCCSFILRYIRSKSLSSKIARSCTNVHDFRCIHEMIDYVAGKKSACSWRGN